MRREMGIAAMVLLASLAADAVVVRKLPRVTVIENETVSVDAQKATAVRSSNATICLAALRESGEAVISGARLGEANLDYVDARGVFATRPVTVVPPYWDVLRRMFSEDPEISIDIVGDKVVIIGATANVDTIKRVEQAKALDTSRIVAQVSYSTAQIGDLVREFLARSGITNITVNVVGRDVCLSGRMYDTQSIDQLKKRVEGFVKDFPGMSVNTDELRIYKQKIMINIEFVAYSDTMTRNLGFSGPESITAGMDWNFGYEHARNTTHGHDLSRERGRSYEFKNEPSTETTRDAAGNETTRTGENKDSTSRSVTDTVKDTFTKANERSHDWKGGANARVEGVQATINLLKKNGAAKSLYSTTLSTQSGIEAEFQSGGTFNIMTTPGAQSNGDLVSIEYGYIIKTTPLIIDDNTVNLDFSLDNKEPMDDTGSRIARYTTKSKYLVRPGESIAISGYRHNTESETKKGTPWLSNIPWIGPYLFGNTSNEVEMNDMLLVVTVNWSVDNDSDIAAARMEDLKTRKVEVEMP